MGMARLPIQRREHQCQPNKMVLMRVSDLKSVFEQYRSTLLWRMSQIPSEADISSPHLGESDWVDELVEMVPTISTYSPRETTCERKDISIDLVQGACSICIESLGLCPQLRNTILNPPLPQTVSPHTDNVCSDNNLIYEDAHLVSPIPAQNDLSRNMILRVLDCGHVFHGKIRLQNLLINFVNSWLYRCLVRESTYLPGM